MHSKQKRRQKIHLGFGTVLLTDDMRQKIKHHVRLTNPTRTARILGYKCNSGSAINRLLTTQHTIRWHFFEKLVGDIARIEEERQQPCEVCLY